MLKLRQWVYARTQMGLDRSTTILPPRLRRIIRAFTGADSVTSQFVRGLLWRYRLFFLVICLTFTLSALFEGTTLAAFLAAAQLLSGGLIEQTVELPKMLTFLPAVDLAHYSREVLFAIFVSAAVITQFLRIALTYTGLIATAYLAAWVERDVRKQVFTKLVTLPYSRVTQYKGGELTSYMEQVLGVGNTVLRVADTINHASIIIIYSILMLWLSWQATLIGMVAFFLVSKAMRPIQTYVRKISGLNLERNIIFTTQVLEYLAGMRLIHIFDRRNFVSERVEQTIVASSHYRRRSLAWSYSIPGLIQLFTILGLAAFLVISYNMVVVQGNTDFIPLAATFILILYRMMPRVSAINGTLAAIAIQWPQVERVAEFVVDGKNMVEIVPTFALPEPIEYIDFEHISLRYTEDEPLILTDINFSLRKGQSLAFVGSSGAGKSSLLNLLLKLYPISSGQILVNGKHLAMINTSAWLAKIGVVDQDTFLFHDTVESNIRFGELSATDGQVRQAAKHANAHDFIMQLPEQYQTVLGDRGMRLSGGQRQRIAIARALVSQPELLIFDEATSALDSASEQLIQRTIKSLDGQSCVIAIAHRLATIAGFDQIIVLEAGRIVERGTHDALLAQQGRYAAMWTMQANKAGIE